MILGEILARHLENKLGISVDRLFNLSGTNVAHEALIGGQMDLYAEDSASAVTQVLHLDLGGDAAGTYNLCRQQYTSNFPLDWLDPLGIESPLVLVGRHEFGEQIKGNTISQAAAVQSPFRMAAARDFTSRKDGYAAMQTIYNVRLRDAPRMANSSPELFKLLDEKQVDLVATEAVNVHATDGRYLILEDDKRVFQPSLTGVVLRRDAAGKFPGVDAALKLLSGKINLATIRRLRDEVDAKGRRPAELAAEFLRSQGF